jgi:hypothetical protein
MAGPAAPDVAAPGAAVGTTEPDDLNPAADAELAESSAEASEPRSGAAGESAAAAEERRQKRQQRQRRKHGRR